MRQFQPQNLANNMPAYCLLRLHRFKGKVAFRLLLPFQGRVMV